MEFRDVVSHRRMVRRFTDQPVPDAVLAQVTRSALRAPSAGFSQGWDFVVLRNPEARQRFWDATTDPSTTPDAWLRGVRTAPMLILCLSDKGTYLRRYAEADKGWTNLVAETRWPVAYWDIDTGMAALLMLLTAVDEGLGGLFFGVEVQRTEEVKSRFGIPPDRTIVGVVAIGYPAQDAPSGSTRTRRRRGVTDVWHEGEFGSPISQPVPTDS